MSFYLTALFCLSAVIEANELGEFCFDMTKDARPWIIEYVQKVVPKLIWNEHLEGIAKDYGDHGKKPQDADDYIYLEKEMTFDNSTGVRKMATDIMESVSSQTKAALQSRDFRRRYACHVTVCLASYGQKMRLHCVAKKIEENKSNYRATTF